MTARIVRLGLVLAIGVLGIALPASSASALSLYHFVGTVTSPLGSPIAGADVYDGVQSAMTNAQGQYTLREDSTGTFTLTASDSPQFGGEVKTVTVLVPENTTVNFTLPYEITGQLAKDALSTASGPAATTLSITSYAPASGTCVSVTSSSTSTSSQATYVSTASDGASSYTWTLSLPEKSPEGSYKLSFQARKCSSGALLSVTNDAYYLVDNTPPSISDPFPTGVTGSPSAEIGATLSDPGGSGIDESDTVITLDGTTLPSPYAYRAECNASGCGLVVSVKASGLSEGLHQVAISVTDGAGNETTSSFSFFVDLYPPSFSSPSPTGSTGTNSPKLSVALSDDTGIVPSSVSLVISDGVLSCGLPASFTRSSSHGGVISYQVPASFAGACLGEFPLPNGTYSVTAMASDFGGHAASYRWSFSVDAPGPTGAPAGGGITPTSDTGHSNPG